MYAVYTPLGVSTHHVNMLYDSYPTLMQGVYIRSNTK